MGKRILVRVAAGSLLVFLLSAISWTQQQMSSLERGRALEILQVVSAEIKKHYYDPKFHGINWDLAVADARQKIERESSFNMSMSHIAAALASLNDSHTFLIPPQHAYGHDYEFRYQMIGDSCFVTHVRPKSDADAKGVKPGDEILALNSFAVNRDSLWKMHYVFSILRPQPGLRLELKGPSGAQRQVDVNAHVRVERRVTDLTTSEGVFGIIRGEEDEEHLMRARYAEFGDRLLALRVPEFFFSQSEVEHMISRARKHQNLIIDLRGNPGGSVDTLRYLVGGIFDREIKIADRVGRKDKKPEMSKPLHDPFTGKIVVLVDAESASAAELFARIVQLEKRGIVVGDQTSGSVMEAKHYEEKMGTDTVILYGASITESDLIMSDGKSLEHEGVIPDDVVIPSGQDMASGRDPVLAHAAELLGVKITPEEAGKAFPYEWLPE